jgi:hypothetical protein
MAGNDDFNERIRRIQQARGLPVGGNGSGTGGGGAGVAGAGGGGGALRTAARFPQTILHLGLIAIVLGGGGYAYHRSQADADALAAVGLSPDEGDQRSFLTRMVADYLLPYPTGTPAKGDPILFLPAAPADWIRVTEIDAQDADPMAEILARWSALNSPYALDQTPGHATLMQFLDSNRSTDFESRALDKRRSTAMYLSSDGSFVLVGLSYRGSRQSLGEPGDDEGWHTALAGEETGSLLTGDVLERVDLGGFAALNRAPRDGKSLIARPIGKDMDTPNTLRLAVALAPRAVVRIEGLAPPRVAAELLSAIDMPGVTASSAD